MNERALKKSHRIRGDRSFHITNFAVLTLLGLIVLYPLVYVVACSFSSA